MIIRQARAADIPALVELRMRLFCKVGGAGPPAGRSGFVAGDL